MKKQLFLFILMLLPILASAQTVSDVQNSGCLNEKLGDESQRVTTIVLTKEGSTLSVQLLNYEENCCTEDFNATYSISGGSDSELCSVSINVAPTIEYNCDCICPFNLSFTVRDLVPNIFNFDCLWHKGQVELTEGETLVLEYRGITDVKINEMTFPDEDFRNWVLAQEYGKDGVLTEEEIAEVTYMNLFPQNIIAEGHIQSLKGIEYFTAMTKLVCSRNELTELDLSKNTALTWLECYGNHLTELYLSNNPELTYLDCKSNELTTLDVSSCTRLTELNCFDNQLTTLNVSGCSALTMLKCYSNPLTKLNVYGCTSLKTMWVFDNKLSILDVSDCTSLTTLWCDNNQLTLLDVSKNKNLSDLRCGENQLTQLDVSKNTMLTELRCNDNQLTALDLSKNKQLTSLRTYHNPINGKSMDALIESLPTVSRGSWCVVLSEDEEGVVTATQVAAAKAKGWISKYWNESAKNWMDYAGSETTTKYFPTGMTWEEIVVNPNMEQEYSNAHIYEISTDTIIGNVTYRKVLRDNVFSGLCVRESGDKVWLLTKEYPTEILLYNFDWDSNQEVVTEYLKGQEVIGFIGQNKEDYEVRQETTPVGDSQTVVIDGKTYQYYKRFSGTIIRGIGKVSELNRYPCLLSYREPAVILPGIEYFKVRWIKRNGVEIFRSEYAREWTMEIKNDYRPFVEEGKVWKVGNCQAILDNSVHVVDYYYFDGDTIIDGKTCKQMMCQRFVSPGFSDEYGYWTPQPFLRKVGAWYEEDQKVYFYDEITQSMKIKYDFSLGDNETVDFLNVDGYPPYIIGPKQTGGIKGFKGVYRDIMMGQDINTNTPWLEGVGGLDGPFTNVYHPLADSTPDFLMSCVVGDEVIYLNDDYEDGATPVAAEARKRIDFTHTIKIRPKSRMLREARQSLYGEYNDQQLGVNLVPLDDAYLVRIADETGRAVYEKAINAGSIVGLTIDISDYAKGHYTVTVENSLESFTGEFETQTTGISNALRPMKDEGIRNNHIYDLQGRRLTQKPTKGVYIQDGKKVVVK